MIQYYYRWKKTLRADRVRSLLAVNKGNQTVVEHQRLLTCCRLVLEAKPYLGYQCDEEQEGGCDDDWAELSDPVNMHRAVTLQAYK